MPRWCLTWPPAATTGRSWCTTKNSNLHVAAGMDHEIDFPDKFEAFIRADGDLARLTAAANVPQGTSCR